MARPNYVTIHPNLPLDLAPMQLEADNFLGHFFRSWYTTMIQAGMFYQIILLGQRLS